MKNQILLISVMFLSTLLACKKEDTQPVIEKIDIKNGTLLRQGMFMMDVHATSGDAKFYQKSDSTFLVLENFKTDSGPDLYVYLSTDKTITQSVIIDRLKSTTGTFSYVIDPNKIDLDKYPYVLIWCKDFSVLFGSAKTTK